MTTDMTTIMVMVTERGAGITEVGNDLERGRQERRRRGSAISIRVRMAWHL